MDALLYDLRDAARSLRASPGFTSVAVLTLAFGIGANTAIFSLLNALVLRSLPVRQPQQLVEMLFKYPGDPRLNNYSWRDYQRVRDENHVFSDVIAMTRARVQITAGGSGRESLDGWFVSSNFFEALGVRPAMGHGFDAQSSQVTVALLSWSYWNSRFNRDQSAIGRTVEINDVPVTIVGVLPREFFGLQVGLNPPIWMPVTAESIAQLPGRVADGSLRVAIVARLKSGVTLSQAQAEVRLLDRARLAELEARTHDTQWRQVNIGLEPAGAGMSVLRDRFSTSVWLMTAAGSVLLLIACINVATMLLARTASRRRELAVRMALGAGRSRVLRQAITESLLLSSVASLIGLWLAYVGAHALIDMIASGRPPVGWPRQLDIPVPLDLSVLLFACGAGVITGLAFGVVPAWHAFASNRDASLRDVSHGSDAKRHTRLGRALVVAQVALSIVLLNAAAILVRHLTDLRTVGLGFRTDSVLQLTLDWSRARYTPAQIETFNRQLLDRIGAVPGIRSVTLAGMTPISGAGGSQFITVPGFTENPAERRRVSLNIITPKYFETLATPFVAGRDFSADDAGRPRVAIVNQAMARYYFGASNPVGRQFTIDGQPRALEIVGVVTDAKYHDLHETPPRTIYMNAFQTGLGTGRILVMRTQSADATTVAAAVRRAVQDVVPLVPVANVNTLAEQLDASILPERMLATLSAVFGGSAAVLVAIGLFGLLAYSVARRVKEIGIRMAIGATHAAVIRMVVMQATSLVIAGLVVGVPIALLTKTYITRVLTLVAATQARGPVTLPTSAFGSLAVAAIAMAAVGLLASYVPARRAARVDPMIALRVE